MFKILEGIRDGVVGRAYGSTAVCGEQATY